MKSVFLTIFLFLFLLLSISTNISSNTNTTSNTYNNIFNNYASGIIEYYNKINYNYSILKTSTLVSDIKKEVGNTKSFVFQGFSIIKQSKSEENTPKNTSILRVKKEIYDTHAGNSGDDIQEINDKNEKLKLPISNNSNNSKFSAFSAFNTTNNKNIIKTKNSISGNSAFFKRKRNKYAMYSSDVKKKCIEQVSTSRIYQY